MPAPRKAFHRQLNVEEGATPTPRFHPNMPPMPRHDLAGNGQPQARAPVAILHIQLLEALKDPLLGAGRNARALVLDLQPNLFRPRLARSYVDLSLIHI
jgi:hypothetical protein